MLSRDGGKQGEPGPAERRRDLSVWKSVLAWPLTAPERRKGGPCSEVVVQSAQPKTNNLAW